MPPQAPSAVEPGGGCEGPGKEQRVGTQEHPQHDASGPVGGSGEEERAGQSRDAHGGGEIAHDRDQVGPDDCAQSCGDEHRADGPASAGRWGQIRSGVAGLQVGGCACAVDEQGRKQQRDVVQHGGEDDAETAHCAGEVAQCQPRTAAGTVGDASDADGCCGRADGEQRARQAGETRCAEHVLGQERPNGDSGGQSGTAEDLGDDQDRQRALLLGWLGIPRPTGRPRRSGRR